MCVAPSQGAPFLRLLSPAAGSLRGVVSVTVEALPADKPPQAVYASIDGQPPWRPLTRVEPGTLWTARLDTRLSPNGRARLVVRAYYQDLAAPRLMEASAAVTLCNRLRYYWGTLHGHSGFSDGRLLPADAYRYARNLAGLDFFAVTDHAYSQWGLYGMTPEKWWATREAADRANAEGQFVALAGVEWTAAMSVGHVCVLNPPYPILPGALGTLYSSLAGLPVIAKFNHPLEGNFYGWAYHADADRVINLVEVRWAGEEAQYLQALAAGWHVGPDGSDDAHWATWGTNGCWTVLVMPGLSRRNVWTALQRRNCYSTTDRNARLCLRVNGSLMGTIRGAPIESVLAVVYVEDSADDPIEEIALLQDGVVVAWDNPGTGARRWAVTVNPAPGPHYYLCRVRQADGGMMWSAPVWVEVR